MAAPAPLLLPAPSKPVAEPSTPWSESSAGSGTPHYCVFGAAGSCAEAPLTSESPFADAVPLTSESSPELTADVPEQGGPSFAVPEPTRSQRS